MPQQRLATSMVVIVDMVMEGMEGMVDMVDMGIMERDLLKLMLNQDISQEDMDMEDMVMEVMEDMGMDVDTMAREKLKL